ncbi:peroxiredoxin-like family protein [Sphingomonas sp. SRS2]|uniref:peroxiredoxin-like family protein n=1 Tax=Sphingomonas sp. SRS2 TaxID=133190 RepID=UPI0006184692|nr:peroxiredoxin-like family protein [Sphingomonas sp. SRS2]KKC26461.1 alkyl hydroperoxide reductase [Sphingomonas sp. SRS2]
MTDSLTAQFEALHAEREKSWDPARLRTNIEQRRALVAAFDPAEVVAAGDRVEPFTLDLSTGGTVDLAGLTSVGPVALVFFRFAGCPACNIALPHYDRTLAPALARAGIRLVAVSPHLRERGLDDIRTRHGLSFEVASDRGNVLARRFGLTFEPADAVVPENDDTWIGALTGTGSWELPQPAVVIVGTDHIVQFADISPDWLRRTESADIIAAVRSVDTAALV